MEKGDMEDPILNTLLVGGSRPKQEDTELDLLFKRMMTCWIEEKERSYGLKELLKSGDERMWNREGSKWEMGQVLIDEVPPNNYTQDLNQQVERGEKIFKRFLIGYFPKQPVINKKCNQNQQGRVNESITRDYRSQASDKEIELVLRQEALGIRSNQGQEELSPDQG